MNGTPGRRLAFLLLVLSGLLSLPRLAAAAPLVAHAGSTPMDVLDGTYLDFPELPAGFFGTVGGMPSDVRVPGRFEFPNLTFHLPDATVDLDPDLRIPIVSEFDRFNGKYYVVGTTHKYLTDPGYRSAMVIRHGEIFQADVGDTSTVPIEIVALSLQSVAPIEVTYAGADSQFFDVFVELDPAAAQRPGTMTLHRTTDEGGLFDAVLPMDLRFRFVNQNPTGPQPIETLSFASDVTTTGAAYRIVPEPSGLPLGLLGMAICAAACVSRRRYAFQSRSLRQFRGPGEPRWHDASLERNRRRRPHSALGSFARFRSFNRVGASR